MTKEELKARIAQGESSTLQFKLQWSDNEKITKELVAFANSRGGFIVFGVEDKTGRIEGLTYDDVQTISSKAGNMAENNIIPALYIHSHPEEIDGKTVLVVEVPSGMNKPYKTLKGCEIYVKQGADKRQVKDNRELLRMFYDSGQYYPDRMGVPDTSVANLSESLIDRFFLNQFNKRKEDFGVPVQNLYQNLCIIDEKGQATLAGMLFFGVMPTWKCPAFKIKAVCFVGNELSGTQYRDSVDLEGTIPEIYEQALRFCEGNLRHLQDGQSFNSEGHLEVSRIALEELIQNSLVHREMLGTDVVKLLIFDNRIVIESPGCLPGDLTVEKIKLGWAEMRNPLTAQLCAKTMPYRGLGSGITRALKSGEHIDLVNDIERDKFVATIWRTASSVPQENDIYVPQEDKKGKGVPQGSMQNIPQGDIEPDDVPQSVPQEDDYALNTNLDAWIIKQITDNPKITTDELATVAKVSSKTIKRHISKLPNVKYVGSGYSGHWEILDK